MLRTTARMRFELGLIDGQNGIGFFYTELSGLAASNGTHTDLVRLTENQSFRIVTEINVPRLRLVRCQLLINSLVLLTTWHL